MVGKDLHNLRILMVNQARMDTVAVEEEQIQSMTKLVTEATVLLLFIMSEFHVSRVWRRNVKHFMTERVRRTRARVTSPAHQF